MRQQRAFYEPLAQRLFLLYLILGLAPTLLLAVAPTVYVLIHGPESVIESLVLMWAAQGVTFLIIVLIGAGVTLRRLVIPIQELVNGAQTIAEGNLAYRVPIRKGDESLVSLSRTFNAMAQGRRNYAGWR